MGGEAGAVEDRDPAALLRHQSGLDLKGINLRASRLNTTNLQGADLTDAVLSGADLTGASVAGAEVKDLDVSGAKLIGLKGQDTARDWSALKNADRAVTQASN